MRVPTTRLPALPALVQQKLSKTGYTRGASPREIFQNRVSRSGTVLIEHRHWLDCRVPDDGTTEYENGFIVLVDPTWYMDALNADEQLGAEGLILGVNALLLFRRRHEWQRVGDVPTLPDGRPLAVATRRTAPLNGQYFARVHGTVAANGGGPVVRGYDHTSLRGAGIRVYEYASTATIAAAKLQLEALIWMCHDADEAMEAAGMTSAEVETRKRRQLQAAEKRGLLDINRLKTLRIVDEQNRTICPLCRELMSAGSFLRREEQAAGREVFDNTITEVSLFHIQELRVGKLQHKTYNLAWGHHFCNVVVKDAGIMPTLQWMKVVLDNQPSTADMEDQAASVEEAVDG